MKHYKDVEIPAKTEKRVTHITCDVCGKKGREGDSRYGGGNWAQESYDHDEACIALAEGSIFPEGGNLEITEWHKVRFLQGVPSKNKENVDEIYKYKDRYCYSYVLPNVWLWVCKSSDDRCTRKYYNNLRHIETGQA